MCDQLRWDACGPGNGYTATPAIDQLASSGVRYSSAVTTSPDCVPARFSLATGLYPHNTGLWQNANVTLPSEASNWIRDLQRVGYHTALIGKSHYHPHQGDIRDREPLMHAYGFDTVLETVGPRAAANVYCMMTEEWEKQGVWQAYKDDIRWRIRNKPHIARPSPLGFNHYYDTYVGTQAEAFIRGYDSQAPLFCWVSFGGPHEPWDAPEPYHSRYLDTEPTPARGPLRLGSGPKGLLHEALAQARPRHPAQLMPADVKALRQNYAANVRLIDDQIGNIIQALKERGMYDDAIFIFTSDHGEMNGDHGLLFKWTFLDGALRIPMIISTPSTRTSTNGPFIVDSPVELIDIPATLLSGAGVEPNEEQYGIPLLDANGLPLSAPRETVISEFGAEVMLMTNDWKIVLNAKGIPTLLFDRNNDPAEIENLVAEPDKRTIRDELKGVLRERLAASPAQPESMLALHDSYQANFNQIFPSQ